jgi:hypothetical protein
VRADTEEATEAELVEAFGAAWEEVLQVAVANAAAAKVKAKPEERTVAD